MERSFGKLEHLDPRTLWRSEAGDFTPWLADNLPLLGEALGLDLELHHMEGAVGEFSCDIVAREVGTNRPVVSENQLGRTDHGHLGQLLTYAGGLDAAVVWISPEVRDEHRKAPDWLNRQTGEDIDFFGVVVEAIRIDASKPAIQFRPVAVPNDFGKRAPKEAISERGLVYKRFFQSVLDELREKYKFTNARIAQPQGWYSFASGVSGFQYGVAFQEGHKRLQTELYIDTRDKERNKVIFDRFLTQKSEIESAMAEGLQWERFENRRASRICAVRPNTTFVDAVEYGDELKMWSGDHLLRLKQVFGPKLSQMLAATTPTPALETTSRRSGMLVR